MLPLLCLFVHACSWTFASSLNVQLLSLHRKHLKTTLLARSDISCSLTQSNSSGTRLGGIRGLHARHRVGALQSLRSLISWVMHLLSQFLTTSRGARRVITPACGVIPALAMRRPGSCRGRVGVGDLLTRGCESKHGRVRARNTSARQFLLVASTNDCGITTLTGVLVVARARFVDLVGA
jgi:hypothetical protein